MIIRKAELKHVCGTSSRFPETGLPQIAFAGRSNAGKSSLINTLLGRKALARTSSQPGKTQTVNYYYAEGKPQEAEEYEELFLVDLPGYGYTRASEEVRKKWGQMTDRYLRTAQELRAVFLLVDIRHTPSANDLQMYEWIRAAGFSPVLVAAKLDKIRRSQLAKQLRLIRETLGAEKQIPVVPFSSVTGQGREQIWEIILDCINRRE